MLTILAVRWRLMLFRGVIAVLFGVAALLGPVQTRGDVAILFGSYAVLNGAAALIMAGALRGDGGFGSLLLEGGFGIAAGGFALLYPATTDAPLVSAIAAWAIVTGLAALAAARALRRDMSGEWPLPFAGTLALLLGLLVLVRGDAGALTLTGIIGWYAVLAGASYTVLAVRMRQLAQEITHA